MEKPRILALDIGSKRTGVALSDELRLISSPLTTVEAKNKKEWAQKIIDIVEESEAGSVLVGVPLNQHGEEGADAKKAKEFIALLRERLSVPVIEWDERFTTVQAENLLVTADVSRMKRKQVIDKVAAAIILQSYLDSLRFSSTHSMDDG